MGFPPLPLGWLMVFDPSSEFDLEMFDPIAYLQDRNIEYFESGKNVSKGWVNIQCPFCQDHSNHLGINLESKLISCWVCGIKGPVTKLIQEIESCNPYQARLILKGFTRDFSSDPYQDIPSNKNPARNLNKGVLERKISWPKGAVSEFPRSYLRFLLKRRVPPRKTILKYKLKAGLNTGEYKFRIVIPVFLNHQIITFVGRDITGKAREAYKNHPEEKSILSVKKLLYRIDETKGNIILVEGIIDCWRIGDGSCATFGTKVTKEQINLLLYKKVKRIFLLPDADAIDEWEDLADQLSPIFDHVELIKLSKGDPADLKRKDIKKLRSWAGLPKEEL